MTDTFSYNPPVAHQAFPHDFRLGEPHMFSQRQQGGYSATQTQSNGTNGYDLEDQLSGGTLHRRGGGGSGSQESVGSETPVAGGAESQELYSKGGTSAPILSPTFPTSYQSPYNNYTQQSIVNMRNTRPMTAPSSVSAPYFQGGLYASATSTPTSSASFYPVHLQQHQLFQYTVDGGEHGGLDSSRGRGFSLPELVGVAASSSNGSGVSERLSDDARYIDQRRATIGGMPNGGNGVRPATTEGSPGSTFLYGPPPPVVEEQYYLQEGSSPDEQSRPTTGESYHNPSADTSRAPHLTNLQHSSANSYQSANHSPYTLDNTGRFPKSDDPFAYLTKASTLQHNNSTSKRPRRRFDEIERLYTCDYPGCLKAYGTLNHLNSHKTMQKHGPKSTPAQFKELRKAWRDNKKLKTVEAAARQQSNSETSRLSTYTSEDAYSNTARSGDRPRPATAGGEYYHNVSSAFPGGQIASAPVFTPQMHLPANQFQFESLQHQSPVGAYSTAPYQNQIPTFSPSTSTSYSSHRPVTAPSYYSQAPSFGSSFGYSQPQQLASGHIVGGMSTPAFPSMGGRRMSLPNTEMRMPTPFGFSAGEGGFGIIHEEGAAYTNGGSKSGDI